MSFFVEIIADPSEVNKVMQQLQVKLSPAGLAAFLQTIVDPFIRNRIEGRFNSEGDDVSGAWHPLEQATQQIRAAYGYPPDHPINMRTGKMRTFLTTTQSDVKMTGMGAELTHPPLTADAVMNKKIATAQMGSPSPSTPARPVVGLNDNDLLFITSELVVYITEGMI